LKPLGSAKFETFERGFEPTYKELKLFSEFDEARKAIIVLSLPIRN